MWDFLNRIDNATIGMLAFLLPVVGGLLLFGLVAMLLTFRHHARTKQQEHELKREMIAKGMSPADIERVINATAGGSPGSAVVTAAATAAATAATGPGFAKTRLVATLMEHGMDAVGVEKVLRVLAYDTDDELPAKVAAIANMVETGMEADDIERVVRAFQRTPPAPVEPRPTAFRE